jgi:hypothetical protein
VAALELAGASAVGTIASALEQVYDEARNRFGPWDASPTATAAYAHRTLTAGRPGSWEAEAIMDVVRVAPVRAASQIRPGQRLVVAFALWSTCRSPVRLMPPRWQTAETNGDA